MSGNIDSGVNSDIRADIGADASSEVSPPIDTLIIGSGLGGLTAAALLAKAGQKVLVVERHSVPGGFTHTFSRKGYEWDVGVHYVGQVHDEKSILRKIFDYVTEGELKWAPVGEVYDRAIINGKTYDFVSGSTAQTEKLISYFPDEATAIRAYIKLVKSVGGSSAWFFGEKTMPRFLSRTAGKLLRRNFEKYASLTTDEVIRSLTNNEELISVLCTQCGDYGLPPKKSSFGVHALVIDHYLDGASYPVGGARRIYETLVKVLQKNRGELRLKSDVAKIIVEQDRAVGVELVDGTQIRSRSVISNAGVRNTFLRFLKDEPTLPSEIVTALSEVKPSTAHVCLYVGLRGSDKELNLPKHNLWIFNSGIYGAASDEDFLANPNKANAVTYISFPSAKDPDWSATHPGKATIQIIAPCDFRLMKEWEETRWGRRGPTYAEMKEEISNRLLETLFKELPALRDQVAYTELSTPLSTKHFSGYGSGEIYGLEHTPTRFFLRFLRPETFLKGLFLTGQDVVTVGVGGALYSGVLAATKVLNKSVMMRILFKRDLGKRNSRA